MSILLISYSIHEPGQQFLGFEQFIRNHNHVKFSETSYAIETTASPFEVQRRIKPYFDENVFLVVMHLNINAKEPAFAQI